MEIISSIVLAIFQSILFYGKEIGISMLLFSVIGNVIIYYILNKNKKIKNKNGFILIIPIILLSSTYFIFANRIFYILNMEWGIFMEEKKNLEVVSGDGSNLDISPVYDNISEIRPKSTTQKPSNVVIPKETHKPIKDKKKDEKKKEENK